MTFNITNHKKDLLFLPLGGANEIGMNVNLYHYKGKWLMFDLGAGFADESLPGIDMLVPDLSFVQEIRKDFLGVVLTHGHEDHLGAVHYLWQELECPIYATPFTASILKNKLKETDFGNDVDITLIDSGSELSIGPFDLEMIQLTHSIPEMNAFVIKTEYGNILHTGDWKFDPNPLIGPESNHKALAKYGADNPLALVCDSTNVFTEGISGSEGDLRESLTKLIRECKNMVVVTTFASNVARVETIAKAAKANNRKIAITGRSLFRITNAAKENGYLKDIEFIRDDEINRCPRNELLVLCTGCQGELNAALSKMCEGTHPNIRLKPHDNVIFSSKIIPGNEKRIFRLFNKMIDMGVEVMTERDHFVHVSGHPSRDELKEMYEMTRPKIAIPVHGERAHIHEHVKFASELGVEFPVQVQNGDIIKIAPGNPEKINFVKSGYLAVDGSSIIPTNSDIIKTRRRIQSDGLVLATIILGYDGELLTAPKIIAPGILDLKEDKSFINDLAGELEDVLQYKKKIKNNAIESKIVSVVKKFFKNEIGKIPRIEVQIVRV